MLILIADDVGIDAALPYHDANDDGVADDGRAYAPVPNIAGAVPERDPLRKRVVGAHRLAHPGRDSNRALRLPDGDRLGHRQGPGAGAQRNHLEKLDLRVENHPAKRVRRSKPTI